MVDGHDTDAAVASGVLEMGTWLQQELELFKLFGPGPWSVETGL